MPFRELIVEPGKSLPKKGREPSLDDNLIIHGDNLEALKALLPRYAGKIDVAVIDPPYNTGKESWVYNDNVKAPAIADWLGKTVGQDDLERHDKWLSMMMPRLRLIHDLLSPKGVLWITLDDHEQSYCKCLCDEIFGRENFVANIAWHARDSVQNDTDISTNNVNHIIGFAKSRRKTDRRLKKSNEHRWAIMDGFVLRPKPIDPSRFANPDEDPRGPWKLDPFDAPGVRTNLQYEITNPKTGEVFLPPDGRHWGTEEETFEDLLADGRILFGKNGKGRPGVKTFLCDKDAYGEVDTNWWDGPATTTDGVKELARIIGKGQFDNPKPSDLFRDLIKMSSAADAVVLDSFAGSGTAAHSVLELNKAEGSTRRFILVEMEDYCETITAERVRRVIKGYKFQKKAKKKTVDVDVEGLGGSFTYCKLGEPMDMERFFAEDGNAPDYDQVARYVAYTATGEALDAKEGDDGFAGYAGKYRLNLIYKSDPKWMRSNEAMLDLTTAERIAETAANDGNKPVLVFAAGKLMGQRALTGLGITFCQLPYSVYRILGSGTEGVAGADEA